MRTAQKLLCILLVSSFLAGCESSREEKAITAAKQLVLPNETHPQFRHVIFVKKHSDRNDPDELQGNVCGEVKFDDPKGIYTDYARFIVMMFTYKNGEENIAAGFTLDPKKGCQRCFEQKWQAWCHK